MIEARNKLRDELGYAWYGKLGSKIFAKVSLDVMKHFAPRILLIHSGATERYGAYIDIIQNDISNAEEIPEYYRKRASDFKTWFRVIRFEKAPRGVLSHCLWHHHMLRWR